MPAGLDQEAAAAALRVTRKVARSKAGGPFSAPVSEQDVPGYRAIIKKPMDLGTIAQRLESGLYRSLGMSGAQCTYKGDAKTIDCSMTTHLFHCLVLPCSHICAGTSMWPKLVLHV